VASPSCAKGLTLGETRDRERRAKPAHCYGVQEPHRKGEATPSWSRVSRSDPRGWQLKRRQRYWGGGPLSCEKLTSECRPFSDAKPTNKILHPDLCLIRDPEVRPLTNCVANAAQLGCQLEWRRFAVCGHDQYLRHTLLSIAMQGTVPVAS
jgi:hypothetical protein